MVVNTVGQGNQIDNAVGSFDVEYLDNRSASTTLDNTAGGIVPGSASVTVAWDFGQADEFQTISSSLEPVH